MDASEIQRITLEVLRRKLKLQVQPDTPYSLSEVAADPAFVATYPNSFIVAFLATPEEYLAFQRQVNDRGLYVAAHTFTILDGSEKQVHDCLIVEFNPNRPRRRWLWGH